ncbi:MAG: MBL fold metallo-hydrolase [Acidobacteria bacterium]|nr:MBL fold metallo-hydrolase [Acidobacteriota bacterium]
MKRTCTLFLLLLGAAFGQELEFRIVYDNTSALPDTPQDWGFATLVDFRGQRLLFDSGTKPDLFLANLKALHIDPASIPQAVISHEHPDHRSGIYRLWPQNPSMRVHFLDNFAKEAYNAAAAIHLRPNRVQGPFQLAPGMYSTGIIEGQPCEQSLVMETSKGIVLLTGCCHPGVAKIVETVEKQRGKDSIRLLIGGFHMFQQNAEQIRSTIARLHQLNVQAVIPAHCTGDLAKQLFQESFGPRFSTAGAGKRIVPD